MKIRSRYTAVIAGLGAAALIVTGAACNSGAKATGGNDAAYCAAVKDLSGRIENYNAAQERGANHDELKALLTIERKSLDSVVEAAPGHIKTALKPLVELVEVVLSDDAPERLLEVLMDPAGQAGAETFESYTRERCGITLPAQEFGEVETAQAEEFTDEVIIDDEGWEELSAD